ncbi:discoidin domain-containing protein [Paenibacillus cymbidii]|uniref:discoidin domain-containing protein n=1 Tax=Paenibacillus cymbidii TaxID=1639034 RepID=UPI0010811DEB|nr:discoidin domain-containing protein [Paenibacillus cymbidii]
MFRRTRLIWLAFFLLATGVALFASERAMAAASDRYTMDLSGTWSFTPVGGTTSTMKVPDTWDRYEEFKDSTQAAYERTVYIPADWAGHTILIDCEKMSAKAEVYINNSGTPAGTQTGVFMPFTFDITPYLTPGADNTIKIVVTSDGSDIRDANGKPLWPVGSNAYNRFYGLQAPVVLKAVPQVHVESAFVRTSVTAGEIAIDYVVRNDSAASRTLVLSGSVRHNGTTEKTLADSAPFTVGAGQTATITVSESWSNAVLWFPDNPYMYQLAAAVKESGTTLDTFEAVKFGFKEVKVDTTAGNLLLNGIRLNLRGDSPVLVGRSDSFSMKRIETDIDYVKMIEEWKGLNMNVVRSHKGEFPEALLDLCDEMGMLVISETTLFGSIGPSLFTAANWQAVKANSIAYYNARIPRIRNHPSIVFYSPANELYALPHATSQERKDLVDAVRAIDPTRPVCLDGDWTAGGGVTLRSDSLNSHYQGGFHTDYPVNNDIYGRLSNKITNSLIMAYGEFLMGQSGENGGNNRPHTVVEVQAMQGLQSRAARYKDYADIRPFSLDWAWKEHSRSRLQADILRKSFAPVAVFDKEYDRFGVNPLLHATEYPAVASGGTVSRTLIVYNDEFSDSSVTLKWYAYFGGSLVASNKYSLSVPLGGHAEQNVSFTAPAGNGNLVFRMEAWKGGSLKFDDTRHFKLGNGGDDLAPGAVANLTAHSPTETSVVLNWNAPGNDGMYGRASFYDIRYATAPITAASWPDAVQVPNVVPPSAALDEESMEIFGLLPGTTYYFAIKSFDGRNTSGLSNAVSLSTVAEGYVGRIAAMAAKSSSGDAVEQWTDDLAITTVDQGYVTPAGGTDPSAGLKYTFLNFDIAAISDADNVYLKLFYKGNASGKNADLTLYGIDDTSWTNATAFTQSGLPGIRRGSSMVDGDKGLHFIRMQSLANGSVGKYVTIDVTEYVKSRLNAGQTKAAFMLYGFNMYWDDQDYVGYFAGINETGHEPALVVKSGQPASWSVGTWAATDPDANAAIGTNATASTTYSSAVVAAQAVDGQPSTWWTASSGAYPQWLQVDLGEPFLLRAVKGDFNYDGTTYYKLEGSLDNVNWTTVADRTTTGAVRFFEEKMNGAAYRYLKLTGTGNSNGHWMRIAELEVYGRNATPPPRDLARFKAMLVSSKYNDGVKGSKAFDGLPSTWWTASSSAYPQWIKADLIDPRTLGSVSGEIRQTGANIGTSYYKIEGSNDNANWTLLSDKTSTGTQKTIQDTVEGTYRYVRLTLTGNTVGQWASIPTLEFYGGLQDNSGFEANQAATQTPDGWSEWVNGNVAASLTEAANPRSGGYNLAHRGTSAYKTLTYQTKTGLPDGLYTVKAWVRSSGGQNQARMIAKDYGGADRFVNIPATTTYTQVTLADIEVTHGTCAIGFWSDAHANEWITVDDVEFYRQ